MASERALYWMAVGLMAVLLGNHFAAKYQSCLRDSIAMVLERTPSLGSSELLTTPVEARLASLQANFAHQRAACALVEAERARVMAMEQIEAGRVRGTCPRQNVRIVIPEPPVPSDGRI